MNKAVNKFLLAGEKFVPKLHQRQPGLTYSACVSSAKNRQRIKNKFKQRGYIKHIYKSELDYAWAKSRCNVCY